MTDAKGQGKSVEELFPCPFFTGAETGQCKSNGSLYAARHLWEEAAKRLKGQIKGQKREKRSETLWFQTSCWQREKDSNPHIRSQSPLCYHYTIPLCSLDEHLLLYQWFCICQELIANFPDFFHFGAAGCFRSAFQRQSRSDGAGGKRLSRGGRSPSRG